MTTTTDTSLNTLIINQLTAEQYANITPQENQIYLVEETETVDEKITNALANYTTTANLANVALSGEYSDLLNTPTVDATYNGSSTNAQSGVAIANLIANYSVTSDFANVAFSGEYTDLLNAPTIPAAQMQSDWAQTNSLSPDFIVNKPSLSTVATSGEYSDLLNTPTIDATYNGSSTNAQSGVAIAGLIANYSVTSDFANVAFSGDFADLTNVPSAATVDQTYNAASTNAQSGVAISGLIANYSTTAEMTNAIANAVSSVYKYKGSVATVADLPASGNTEGDVYNVEATGDNYAWVAPDTSVPGSEGHWDKLAGTVDLSNYVTLNTAQTITNKTINLADNTVIGLATVATSGEYSDLLNTPTIPAAQIQADWGQTDTSALDYIVNKPTLAQVATSGEYSDLLNTPTIPVVDQTFNNASTNAVSGVALANALDTYATKVTFRTWTDE